MTYITKSAQALINRIKTFNQKIEDNKAIMKSLPSTETRKINALQKKITQAEDESIAISEALTELSEINLQVEKRVLKQDSDLATLRENDRLVSFHKQKESELQQAFSKMRRTSRKTVKRRGKR